jgi:hypothetical protein
LSSPTSTTRMSEACRFETVSISFLIVTVLAVILH